MLQINTSFKISVTELLKNHCQIWCFPEGRRSILHPREPQWKCSLAGTGHPAGAAAIHRAGSAEATGPGPVTSRQHLPSCPGKCHEQRWLGEPRLGLGEKGQRDQQEGRSQEGQGRRGARRKAQQVSRDQPLRGLGTVQGDSQGKR